MRKKAPLLCRISVKLIGKSPSGIFNCAIGCYKATRAKCIECPEFYGNWMAEGFEKGYAEEMQQSEEVLDDKE